MYAGVDERVAMPRRSCDLLDQAELEGGVLDGRQADVWYRRPFDLQDHRAVTHDDRVARADRDRLVWRNAFAVDGRAVAAAFIGKGHRAQIEHGVMTGYRVVR